MDYAKLAWQAVKDHHAQQDVDELACFLAVVDSLIMPTCALEIGTARGGLAWALARLPSMNKLVTVDQVCPDGFEWASTAHCAVTTITGDSHGANTYEHVIKHLDSHAPQLVVIDAAHDYDSALDDYDTYGALCSPSGVIMLHDSQGYPGHPEFGVGRLVAELRQTTPVTEIFSRQGGPGGTALVWGTAERHGLQYNDLHN